MASNRKSLAAQIVAIVAKAGVEWPGGAENARVRRTYAGYYQKSGGAWAWTLEPVDPECRAYPTVASQWPASDLVKGECVVRRNLYGDWEIDPERVAGDLEAYRRVYADRGGF